MSPTKTSARTKSRDELDAAGQFTDAELDAMKSRAKELKSSARRDPAAEAAEGEREVLAKIADMPPDDRAIAQRIHEIVQATAPSMTARTYYGMPAYAKDGKVILFFKPASKFKVRYASLGFQPDAKLDDGDMWPSEYALLKLGPTEEKQIAALVKKAVS
jgi:uncharacterized protein YdhG (YjbR/CyaY superfamily)